jgi:hypothetical protein
LEENPINPILIFLEASQDVIKWMDLIRWFKADGSLHYIHARDIAQVIKYLVENTPSEADSRDLVLGNQKTSY